MKQYTVINNKTGVKSEYSWANWNAAWLFVFLTGLILGLILN